MNIHYHLEVREIHLRKGFVPQDAGVVDEHVDPAPLVYRLTDHYLDLGRIRYIGTIRDRLTAARFYLSDNCSGSLARAAGPVSRTAEIVHYDTRAASRKFECVRFSQAITGTRDDHDLIVESDAHIAISSKYL
jgi:hypothetical protein